MRVIVTTDGSKQSLTAARTFKSFTDPAKIDEVIVLAVIRPFSAVSFADEVSGKASQHSAQELNFREAADNALTTLAAEFAGWGPKVTKKVRSGSPANEIIKAATQLSAGLIVVAAGGRGLSDMVLMGSTAQRVQHYAPCPVLVVRPQPRATRKR